MFAVLRISKNAYISRPEKLFAALQDPVPGKDRDRLMALGSHAYQILQYVRKVSASMSTCAKIPSQNVCVRVDPRKLRSGRDRLTARVEFAEAANTKPRRGSRHGTTLGEVLAESSGRVCISGQGKAGDLAYSVLKVLAATPNAVGAGRRSSFQIISLRWFFLYV